MNKNKNNGIPLGNVYDINKQLSHQEPSLDVFTVNKLAEEMAKGTEKYGYIMLLCHERRDYTVFNTLNTKSTKAYTRELRQTLLNRGEIISIEQTTDKAAWEIWIRIDNEDFCYYLFDYTFGMVIVPEV